MDQLASGDCCALCREPVGNCGVLNSHNACLACSKEEEKNGNVWNSEESSDDDIKSDNAKEDQSLVKESEGQNEVEFQSSDKDPTVTSKQLKGVKER